MNDNDRIRELPEYVVSLTGDQIVGATIIGILLLGLFLYVVTYSVSKGWNDGRDND